MPKSALRLGYDAEQVAIDNLMLKLDSTNVNLTVLTQSLIIYGSSSCMNP